MSTPDTAALADTTAPATAAEARVKLDVLKADQDWGKRLVAGDAAARQEFNQLTEKIVATEPADRLGEVLAGRAEVPWMESLSGGELSTRDLRGLVADLRAAGLSDEAIREGIEGTTVPRAVYVAAQNLQRQRQGDAEWRAKLLAGDWAAKREQLLMSIVLSAGVA
jgi:hypothetical protein